jgi:hypothetical protein
MQYTGSPTSAHHHNVNYAKQSGSSCAPSTINHQTSHRKCELLSSESDISSVQIQLRNKLKRNRNDVHSAYVRRKVRGGALGAFTLLLLVLTCLVVNLELVIGALPLNYNSVNYYDNSTLDDSDIVPWVTLTNHIDDRPTTSRPAVIYQNEFAVFIPGGAAVADNVAVKLGYTNMGQVSSEILFFLILDTLPPARIVRDAKVS